MHEISPEKIANTLADIVRDEVLEGRTVVVPRLGSFRIDHFPSRLGKDDSGRAVVLPPRDAIVFEPAQ
jgi:nucleoid DNA-binding protein